MSLHGRQGAAGGQQGRQAGLCRGGRWAWGTPGPGNPRRAPGLGLRAGPALSLLCWASAPGRPARVEEPRPLHWLP